MEQRSAFAGLHPAVCFLFFLGALGFGMVIQHPLYLLAGFLGAACFSLLLQGRRVLRFLGLMVPAMLLLAAVNPLFNTQGSHVLFRVLGRPYTLEALLYGFTLSGMFLTMLLWFRCCGQIITSDKFVCLFGSCIPALSLMLVMVLRMVPGLLRKARQIIGARAAIGKGQAGTRQEKLLHGMTVLSSLTDWALEGSVITADSMGSRGYGTGKHTSFQIYRFTARDRWILALTVLLAGGVILLGGTRASFTPEVSIPPVSWGFLCYCSFLLIPSAIHIKEAITWRILKSGI